MSLKIISLLGGALFVVLLALLLRRRPAASGPIGPEFSYGARPTSRSRTLSIEEIRQRLDNAKDNYKGDREAFARAIEPFVASLRSQYGEQVPAVEVAKHLREFPFPAAEAVSALQNAEPLGHSLAVPGAGATGGETEKTPDGVSVELTLGGFVLRVSTKSFIGGAMWLFFVGALCAIPFVLWGDLIRGVWTDGGLNWLTGAFLTIWAGAVLYAAALGAVGCFGEIRVEKDGDSGEIFTGIGRVGRTHRLWWSEFHGASDRAVSSVSSGNFNHTSHYVGLNGSSSNYKFGSELSTEQQAFVIAFLRGHVFGTNAGPAPGPEAENPLLPKAAGDGKNVSLEQVRQTLERAKADYRGADPEGFKRAVNEFETSLRTQYGEQIPVADAVKRLGKFASVTGAPISFTF